MSHQKTLVESFKTTSWLIAKFADGLSNEDSVAEPPFMANTFNWVLGHILVGRERVLGLLGKAPVFEKAEADKYRSGSEPVDLETAVPLGKLLQVLNASQVNIVEGLEAATSDMLQEIADEERKQTVGERIAGEHWHETYHVGQLEILRQVSGERAAFP